MPSALAERLDRLMDREGTAERVDRDVDASAGRVPDSLRNLFEREAAGMTVTTAPSSLALASLLSKTSTATTIASMAAAICTAESPTPPHPCTATHWPGRTRPWWTTAR
jgi:hypothetical protein